MEEDTEPTKKLFFSSSLLFWKKRGKYIGCDAKEEVLFLPPPTFTFCKSQTSRFSADASRNFPTNIGIARGTHTLGGDTSGS